eukprot:2410195-Pleurochrysis_carterae.AAC.1
MQVFETPPLTDSPASVRAVAARPRRLAVRRRPLARLLGVERHGPFVVRCRCARPPFLPARARPFCLRPPALFACARPVHACSPPFGLERARANALWVWSIVASGSTAARAR